MSHFAEMQVNFEQRHEAELIAALESQFGKGNVEVHIMPVGLEGFQGDDRSKLRQTSKDYAPPCHIIVRRRHVGSAANDIGFRRLETGGYAAYVSDFDKTRNYNQQRQGKVLQEYTLLTSEKTLKTMGYSTTRQQLEDGTVRLIGSTWS